MIRRPVCSCVQTTVRSPLSRTGSNFACETTPSCAVTKQASNASTAVATPVLLSFSIGLCIVSYKSRRRSLPLRHNRTQPPHQFAVDKHCTSIGRHIVLSLFSTFHIALRFPPAPHHNTMNVPPQARACEAWALVRLGWLLLYRFENKCTTKTNKHGSGPRS